MPGIDWYGDVRVWHLLMPKDTLLCGIEISQSNGGCSNFGAVTCPKCKELQSILDNPLQALRRAEAAEIALSASQAEAKRLRELVRGFMELVISEHEHSKTFRESLDSGYCERMLTVIGADIFDPKRRVRMVLEARAVLAASTAPEQEANRGSDHR